MSPPFLAVTVLLLLNSGRVAHADRSGWLSNTGLVTATVLFVLVLIQPFAEFLWESPRLRRGALTPAGRGRFFPTAVRQALGHCRGRSVSSAAASSRRPSTEPGASP